MSTSDKTWKEQLLEEGRYDVDVSNLYGPFGERFVVFTGITENGCKVLDGVVVEKDTGWRPGSGVVISHPSEYDRIVSILHEHDVRVR